MNDNTPVIRRPQRALPPAARTAAAIIATAGLCSLAVACASPSSTEAADSSHSGAAVVANVQSSTYQQMLAYSRCIRPHGVPNFPDPDSSGNLPPDAKQIGASAPQFDAAQTACIHLLPGDNQPKPARTGSGSQSQPSQTKQPGPGTGSRSQPPLVKPTPGSNQ
jgi:hypothetical protein